MDLLAAKDLAIQLMGKHDLINQGWKFEFDNRKNSGGTCRYLSKRITLSKIYVQAVSLEEVKNTILHEIAHALCPKHGHDHVWRRKALEIGCNGERCYELQEDQKTALLHIAPYKAVCSNGHEHFAFRKVKRRKSCGKCSPRFDPKYILEFKRVA